MTDGIVRATRVGGRLDAALGACGVVGRMPPLSSTLTLLSWR
jgi:hypothetical protein